jgi:gas vesicle protein
LVNISEGDSNCGGQITPEDSCDWKHFYKYNESSGVEEELKYLSSDFWYADFEVNQTKGGKVFYGLEKATGADPEIDNTTQELSIGNMSVDIVSGPEGEVDPNETFDIEIEVSNSTDGIEDEAKVEFWATNGTWTSSSKYQAYSQPDQDVYDEDKSFDLSYGSKYVFHAVASEASDANDVGYNNPYGSESYVFETVPELQAEVESLDSTGCTGDVSSVSCDRGADVSVDVNVTSAEADSIGMDVNLVNQSGDLENISSVSLSDGDDDGLWEGSFEVPDINTSKYKDYFYLNFSAVNSSVYTNFSQKVGYDDFVIDDLTRPSQNTPGMVVEFGSVYPNSEGLIEDTERFSGYVNVTDSNNSQVTNFSLEDIAKESDLYVAEFDLDYNESLAPYSYEIFVENKYGVNESLESNLDVNVVDQTFELYRDEVSMDVMREQVYNASLNISGSAQTVSADVGDDISNFTEVNDGSDIDLSSVSSSENKTVNLSFNVTDVQDYSSDIVFNDADSNYSLSLDVELDGPDCGYRNGTLCASGDLDASLDESGDSTSQSFEFNYLGPVSNEATLEPSVNGNISSLTSLDPSSIEVNSGNSSFSFDVNFTASQRGNFTGDIVFTHGDDTLNVPVEFESDISDGSSGGISLSSQEVSLGYFRSGQDRSADVEVTNNGDSSISSFEVSSEDYEVSSVDLSDLTLVAGESSTVTLNFGSVSTESDSVENKTGSVEISGGESSATLSVTANPLPNLKDRANNELNDRKNNLRSRANSSSITQRLSDVSSDISDVISHWESEEYEEAKQTYQEVVNALDSIEADISGGSTGGSDSTSTPSDPSGTGNDNDNGGGAPILPIAIVIILLLVIGFVFYTSYVPEEGDPLYGVLGEG